MVKSKISLALISTIIVLSILLLICITYLQKRRAARDRQEPVPQEVLRAIEKERMYSTKLQRRIDALEKEMERLKHERIVVKEGKVKVFHYLPNKIMAEKVDYEVDPRALLPAEREIPFSDNLIYDTINSLIQDEISEKETQAGFWTGFPGDSFRLLSADLQGNILTLHFDDPKYFTSGGSNRVGYLWLQIRMTAFQFPEVKQVRYKPETLFQP
ncbi:MAG: GerMN domain-containing protein [Proteobacteria bacterium]|nr:GerMN domain-containing protein [Pseudomonadota bacterium]